MPILLAEAPTLSTVITDVTSVITAGGGWLTTAADAVMSSPVAVFMLGLSVVGVGFGLFKRLVRIF